MPKRVRSLASVLWDTDEPGPLDQPSDATKTGAKPLVGGTVLGMPLSGTAFLPRCDILDVHAAAKSCKGGQWAWVEHLRQEVRALDRVDNEILPMLEDSQFCNGRISFDLCKSPKASTDLSHCKSTVSRLSAVHPAVFKIGIAANPMQRWSNPTYGYCWDRRERWQGMKVVAACETGFSATLIESVLIEQFRDTPGCRNERPGGESTFPGPGPVFTYVVFRVLTPPPKVRCQ